MNVRGFSRSLLISGCVILLMVAGMTLALPQMKGNQGGSVQRASNELSRAMELYRADHSGFYPFRAEELMEQGYLGAYPKSPWGGEMRPLQGADAPAAGGFVYVPVGQMAQAGEAANGGGVMPRQVSSYYIVFYGDQLGSSYGEAAEQLESARTQHADYDFMSGAGIDPELFELARGVSWEQVAYISSGGAGGSAGGRAANGCG